MEYNFVIILFILLLECSFYASVLLIFRAVYRIESMG